MSSREREVNYGMTSFKKKVWSLWRHDDGGDLLQHQPYFSSSVSVLNMSVVFVSSSFFPLYSSADLYGKHIPTLQKTGPKQRFRKIRTFQCVSEWVGRLVGVVVPWHVSGPRASYGVNQTATRARCSLCSLLLKGLS